MLRVGGTLAQMAPPAELLARPADPFVAAFVGRDRGYRALGFTAAGDLDLDRAPAAKLGTDLADVVGTTADGWVLVVDDDNHPQGWISTTGLTPDQLQGQITPDLLNLGGTLAHEGGSLREVLDAALSSPSGWGVVVDADGRLAGTITADKVLAQIKAQRSAEAAAAP